MQVAPGTYDEAGGETFPLIVPDGAHLIGDEPSKGDGATPTLITGELDIFMLPFATLVLPGEGSTVAGFRLQAKGGAVNAIRVTKDGVTIRNNSLVDNDTRHALRFEGSDGLVADNVIVGTKLNGGGGRAVGLYVGAPATRVRIERNVIANNDIGLDLGTGLEIDFGDGPTGSGGGNELRCNTDNDVSTKVVGTFFGRNNRWDHVPPTMGGSGGGVDIRNGNDGTASTFHLEGATLADDACP